jgi:xanthine dehydrogenase iron-sulfur cluster and FAD-binding subunit A
MMYRPFGFDDDQPNSAGRKPRAKKSGGTPMVALTVNGQQHDVAVAPNTPLLWVLREHLKLTGTKFGCGIAACGACTVHIDGEPVRSCAMPVSLIAGKSITTIEGLSPDGSHRRTAGRLRGRQRDRDAHRRAVARAAVLA